MRKRLQIILILLLLVSLFTGCNKKFTLKTKEDKASYAIGITVADSFLKSNIAIDENTFFKGLFDVMDNNKTLINDDDMGKILITYQKQMMAKKKNPYDFKEIDVKNPFDNGIKLFNYALGMSLGKNFKFQMLQISKKPFEKGFTGKVKGENLLLKDEEIKTILTDFSKKAQEHFNEERSKQAKENKKKEEEFLSKNKDVEGVMTLPDGIQYKVIKKGTGEKPDENSTVIVNYEGKLLDGTVFDSSYKRGETATISLKSTIKGWQEILPLMRKGAKWRVWIPAKLAYGERGAGASIPPNSLLIFDIELLDIKH